jgi:hypothetical protein
MKLEVRTIKGVEKIIDAISITEKAAQRVTVRALNDTAKWLKSNAARQISKETGVPSPFMKQRFFIRKAIAQQLDPPVISTISVNLYDVRAKDLGRLQQLKSGAKAGKFMFDKAFVATMSANPFNGKRGPSIYKRKGKPRFPVSEMGVEVKTKAEPIVEKLVNEAPAVYDARFQHLLAFETSKIGGK